MKSKVRITAIKIFHTIFRVANCTNKLICCERVTRLNGDTLR